MKSLIPAFLTLLITFFISAAFVFACAIGGRLEEYLPLQGLVGG